MTEQPTAYVVTSGGLYEHAIVRVYLDKGEAEEWVAARRETWDAEYYEVEEWPTGRPPVEFDGPIWEGVYRRYRVEKPPTPWTIESLARLSGGFSYQEHFDPSPREYTGEVKESFDFHEIWHTGDTPPEAFVDYADTNVGGAVLLGAGVRGTSREQVEALLRQVADQLKAAAP